MSFAVVDIEWTYGIPGDIVQLASIMYDDGFNEIKRFQCIVKTTRYRNKDLAFMNLTKEEIEAGLDIKSAVKRFSYWLGNCRNFIVWSKNTKQKLIYLINKYDPRHFGRILALQEEYNEYFSFFSFERICEYYNIPITKPLHISINDCEYLGKIYKILHNIDPIRLNNTIRKHINKAKYAALKTSNIYHKRNCRYIKDKPINEKFSIINSVHGDELGLIPCRCCKPMQAKMKAVDPIIWNEDDVERFCETLKIRCNILTNIIFIYTDDSSWYFYRDSSKIMLRHENTYINQNGHHKWKSDYHCQEICFNDPMDAIWYIYCHDKYKYANRKNNRNL